MYRLLVPLVLTGAALAQMPGPIAFPVFPPPLKDYLALTDQQVQNLLRNNADYNRFVIEKQLRAAQVQREIATETQREQLDPMALGLRYVELERLTGKFETA